MERISAANFSRVAFLAGKKQLSGPAANGYFERDRAGFAREVLKTGICEHRKVLALFELLSIPNRVSLVKACINDGSFSSRLGTFVIGRILVYFLNGEAFEGSRIKFWNSFDDNEAALLASEWTSASRYLNLSSAIGAHKAFKKISDELRNNGLPEITINTGTILDLITLKLSGRDIKNIRASLPRGSDWQARSALTLLNRPYKGLFKYWDYVLLESVCSQERVPVPVSRDQLEK